jgi:hypothetical protein
LRRSADPVIVECDLLRTRQIERLERRPHDGAPDVAGGIAGASDSRMIRLFAIRTLAQVRSRETGIHNAIRKVSQGFSPSTLKWATIALSVCPPAKMTRAIRCCGTPPTCAPCDEGRAFARHQYCGAALRNDKRSFLAIRLTICFVSDRAAQPALLSHNGCGTILRSASFTRPSSSLERFKIITGAAARLHRE